MPLPKSQTPARMAENLAVFDFTISPADMSMLDSLDEGPAGALFPFNVSLEGGNGP